MRPKSLVKQSLPLKALTANTVGFALCFAAWVIFGPSSRGIAVRLHLSPVNVALLKALPILVGSLLRIPIGVLTDRIGARTVFPVLMLLGSAACFAIPLASSWPQLAAGALLLGMVGASFAVGVQSVSAWSPASRQGMALGILGAGNAGTALTTLFFPLLLASLGFAHSFHVYGTVLAIGAVLYWFIMRDKISTGPPRTIALLLKPLSVLRTWRFALYYMATFGAFVGATLVLSDIYLDAYHLTLKNAGFLATTFTLTSSLARIPGGKLADRFGARIVLRISLAVTICSLIPVLAGPPVAITGICICVAGLAMGIGMAATMRYIPQYFPTSVGVVGGIVGALGGVGGFALTLIASAVKTHTGSSFLQVAPLIALAVIALLTQSFAVVRIRSQSPEESPDTVADDLNALRASLNPSEALEPKLTLASKQ